MCACVLATYDLVFVLINLVTGEICSSCLQLYFDPSLRGYCVGSVITVTVSSKLPPSLPDTVTLMVNDRVCNNSDDGIVKCVQSVDFIINNSYTFILTTINNHCNVTIKAHTKYYGADWYSDVKNVTIEDFTKRMYVRDK